MTLRLDSTSYAVRALEARLNGDPAERDAALTRLRAIEAHGPPITRNTRKDTRTMNQGLPPAEREALKRRMGVSTEPARIGWDPGMRTTRVFPVLAAPARRATRTGADEPGDDMPSRAEVVAFLKQRAAQGDDDAKQCLRAMGEREMDTRLAAMLPAGTHARPHMQGASMVFPVRTR